MVETAPLTGLVVDIEGRVDKLEKAMAKANAIQKRGTTDMERRAKQSTRIMEDTYAKSADKIGTTISNMFANFSKGGAALVGAGGAVLALKEIADSVAEVSRESARARVTTQTWQQWRYVAIATGASIDGMTDALKELNIRGAEFAMTGKGSAADAFARLGYTASDVAERLKDPTRFIDELIGKLQKLSSGEQALNIDELFGGTGAEELSKMLGLSVGQLQKLRSEAATFSNEQIEAAQKVSAEWDTMWNNFMIRAKGAAIEGVGVAKSVVEAIRGLKTERELQFERDWTPDKIAERLQQERLRNLTAQRQDLADQIAAVEATPVARVLGQRGIDERNTALDDMRKQLIALDARIKEVTEEGQKLNEKVKELDTSGNTLAATLARNTASAANFKTALAELKALVPDLKAELDSLAQSNAMETAYQKAARNARSWGELMQATDIANRARSVATFGQHNNMLDLIGAAEGTDKGRGYNETLDYGRWTGGAVNLTGMTLDQVRALQRQMLADPANRALYGNGLGSSAVGRYQITGRTLESLIQELGLSGDRLFDEATQDELARALLRRRGNDPAELRNEWEGLRRVDDSTIRNTYAGTPTAARALDPTPGQQRQTDLLKQQTDARRNLNQSVQEGLDLARFQQSISGMSERQQRIELEVYRALQQAKRDGITLSNQEVQKLREKIMMTDALSQKNQQVQASTEGLRNAQQFFAEGFTSSLSGLLTGTTTLQQAVQNLLNSLIDASLQAALLGKGPLSGLFGTAGGTGLLGMLFGFSSGGYTGDGGKYEPKGIVHGGEVVWSQDDIRRAGGVATVEAMRLGKPGYDKGGLVGSPARLAPVSSERRGSAVTAQAITINSPVTVNATGGDPQQNADLARQVAKEHETMMRGLVRQELFIQMKPGNLLNR